MTEKRFSIEREVDMLTGRVVEVHLVDNLGNLPRLAFFDPSDLYEYEKALTEELDKLYERNKELKKQRDCVRKDLRRLKKDYLELSRRVNDD